MAGMGSDVDRIADYYIYDENGELKRRIPFWSDVREVLRENPTWYVRTVQFSDDPVYRLPRCPTCGQVQQGDKQSDNREGTR